LIGPFAVAAAVQLAGAAAMKWFAPAEPGDNLLERWTQRWPWRRVTVALVAVDLLAAALILASPMRQIVAGLGALLVGVYWMLGPALSPDASCGCFGSAVPRTGQRWRESTAKAAFIVKTLLVALGIDDVVQWHLPLWVGLSCGIGMGAASVAVVRPWQLMGARTERERVDEALRRLAREAGFSRYREFFMSDEAVEGTTTASAVQLVFELWVDGRLCLLLATVSRRTIDLDVVDAVTLEPVTADI
jgi:hypothetical protein